MIAVIADDITGAAEIAGIGLRFGMKASIVTDLENGGPDMDLLVYATDTRSMKELDALHETTRAIRQLQKKGYTSLFKKVDSALRGHIGTELQELMKVTGLKRALCIPENPSKGRIVREGIYYIQEVPLDRTSFAHDPEYPAFSARLTERIPQIDTILTPGDPVGAVGIFAADAESTDDIKGYVCHTDSSVLLAGGADLFTAFLRHLGWQEEAVRDFEGLGDRNAVIVCGSTVNHPVTELPYFRRKNVPYAPMPKEVFELNLHPDSWITRLEEMYETCLTLALAVGHPPRAGANYAMRLRHIMALAVSSLIGIRIPDELMIEGGATAFTVLHALGWSSFEVTDEIAPGVVRMKLLANAREKGELYADVHVTLKPGSYPWGVDIFK